MSWDVLLCKFSRKYTHVDQMAKDEKFLVLGVRDAVSYTHLTLPTKA